MVESYSRNVSRGVIGRMADISERILGLSFPPGDLYWLANHTVRKWENMDYGEDYLPILFENELRDYLMRREINAVGRMNYERNLQCSRAQA